MSSQTSRKIIIATGMAVLVGVGATLFALRSHTVTAVLQTSIPPAPPAQASADSSAAIATSADSSATVGGEATMPAMVEPQLAGNRQLAKTSTGAAATIRSDARREAPAEAYKEPAVGSVATIAYPVAVANDVTMSPPTGGVPAMESPASDSEITAAVKSELAVDGVIKDANIGVTTTNGVVVLTGSLGSQTAIDHVKDVAAKVKDVKSVDASALVLAGGSDAS